MKSNRSLLVLALCMGLAAPAFAQTAAAPTSPEAAPADDFMNPQAAPAEAAPADDAAPAISPADAAAASELQPMTEGQPEQAPAPMPEAAPAPAPAPVVMAGPAPAEPTPVGDEERNEDAPIHKKCALGNLCMGPVLSLAVINPFGFGAHARYGEHLGFGIDYQFMPTVGLSTVNAGWSLFTVEGRWYPFGGAFFLGGGFAYQAAHMSTKLNTGIPGSELNVKGALSMPALKFGLGFMGHDGFVMGIDLALNVPLGGTNVNFQMPSGAAIGPAADMVAKAHKDINDAANKGIKLLPFVPQLNLIRIGYLF
jgi:hypothetical protein